MDGGDVTVARQWAIEDDDVEGLQALRTGMGMKIIVMSYEEKRIE